MNCINNIYFTYGINGDIIIKAVSADKSIPIISQDKKGEKRYGKGYRRS